MKTPVTLPRRAVKEELRVEKKRGVRRLRTQEAEFAGARRKEQPREGRRKGEPNQALVITLSYFLGGGLSWVAIKKLSFGWALSELSTD